MVANASDEAARALESGFASLGIDRFRGLLFTQSLAATPVTVSPDLEAFLAEAGTSVLSWCRHRTADLSALQPDELAACEQDALGYSGARALMCTPFNVPTGTFTAFWAPGYVNGEPWMPLLLRRGYLKRLILS